MIKHGANIREPMPIKGKTDIIDLVKNDLDLRKAEGVKKYGRPLEAFNERDALWDAYQEALDLAAYLRQAIAERDSNGANSQH